MCTTRSPSIRMPRSTAFSMSYTVKAATLAAVSASISTPVRPVVRTVALISTPASTRSRSSVTAETGNGWHSGIRSAVRLLPMIPASRATPSTSPFFAVPASTIARVAGCM